jgi:Zn-finger nucleic acid-binding protein
MKCPACAADMVEVNIQHSVLVDRCPQCAGVVLDKGESEMVEALGLSHVIEGGVVATHQNRQGIAHCYECGKDMVALRGAGDVEFDWCEGCERLFFDRGELTALSGFSDGGNTF